MTKSMKVRSNLTLRDLGPVAVMLVLLWFELL